MAIKKIQRIRQLSGLIYQISTYIKNDPNPFAVERVKNLDTNPCSEGNYYLNAIFKSLTQIKITNKAEQAKYVNKIIQEIEFGAESKFQPELFIIQHTGLFQDNKIQVASSKTPEKALKEAEAKAEKTDNDCTVYMYLNNFFNNIFEELKINLEDKNIKIFDVYLNTYNQCQFLEVTRDVIKYLPISNPLVSVENVPKEDIILNYTKLKQFIDERIKNRIDADLQEKKDIWSKVVSTDGTLNDIAHAKLIKTFNAQLGAYKASKKSIDDFFMESIYPQKGGQWLNELNETTPPEFFKWVIMFEVIPDPIIENVTFKSLLESPNKKECQKQKEKIYNSYILSSMPSSSIQASARLDQLNELYKDLEKELPEFAKERNVPYTNKGQKNLLKNKISTLKTELVELNKQISDFETEYPDASTKISDQAIDAAVYVVNTEQNESQISDTDKANSYFAQQYNVYKNNTEKKEQLTVTIDDHMLVLDHMIHIQSTQKMMKAAAGEIIVSTYLDPKYPYKSLYIDTIDYNELGQLFNQLEKLFNIYNSDSFPNVIQDENDKKKKRVKVDENGYPKTNNDGDPEMQDRPKHCSWYYPMDCTAMFGLSFLGNLLPPLFKITDYETENNDGKTKIVEKWQKIVDKETNYVHYKPKYKSVQRQVSLKDGYAYVPNGIKIKMNYQGLIISPWFPFTFIPGIGPDYGALLAGYYTPKTLKDQQNMMKFPYQNDIPSRNIFLDAK